ncbi:MAG: putative DNA-binding domain-containing protein [Candidatus Kapaibacterium sp.]
MLLKKETHNIQSKLADYCKTGLEVTIEGAKQDRLHHYRRLTYNIIKGALATAYPIAKETLTEKEWLTMVDDYFANHKMQTPIVWKMPFEFYEYCVEQKYGEKFDRPYLDELLYFEWIEIEIHTMEDMAIPIYIGEGDILRDKLVVTPEHELLAFEYPVHKFKGDELLDKKASYFVLIFRKNDTGAIRFINLSAFFALTLQTIIDENTTLESAIRISSETFGIDESQAIQHGLALANDLVTQGFVLGFSVL